VFALFIDADVRQNQCLRFSNHTLDEKSGRSCFSLMSDSTNRNNATEYSTIWQ